MTIRRSPERLAWMSGNITGSPPRSFFDFGDTPPTTPSRTRKLFDSLRLKGLSKPTPRDQTRRPRSKSICDVFLKMQSSNGIFGVGMTSTPKHIAMQTYGNRPNEGQSHHGQEALIVLARNAPTSQAKGLGGKASGQYAVLMGKQQFDRASHLATPPNPLQKLSALCYQPPTPPHIKSGPRLKQRLTPSKFKHPIAQNGYIPTGIIGTDKGPMQVMGLSKREAYLSPIDCEPGSALPCSPINFPLDLLDLAEEESLSANSESSISLSNDVSISTSLISSPSCYSSEYSDASRWLQSRTSTPLKPTPSANPDFSARNDAEFRIQNELPDAIQSLLGALGEMPPPPKPLLSSAETLHF